MIQIKDMSIIDRYLDENPMEGQENARLPYQMTSEVISSYYYPASDEPNLDICLCDWGAASWSNHHLTEVIQPVLLRAPEVVIRAPWGPAVDIWNLGAVLLELVDGVHMFEACNRHTGLYDVKKHIEEMTRLFGRFPRNLLEQGDQNIVERCFHRDGSVIDPEDEETARLEDWVENSNGVEKETLIAFLRAIMVIDPNSRKTARELLDEPWLMSHGH